MCFQNILSFFDLIIVEIDGMKEAKNGHCAVI